MLESRYNTYKIGERVKYLREKFGLNQTDLADLLGVGQVAISNIESNKSSISIDLLVKLCKYFNVTADFILSLDDDKLETTNEIIDLNINPNHYIYIENLNKDEQDCVKITVQLFNKNKENS